MRPLPVLALLLLPVSPAMAQTTTPSTGVSGSEAPQPAGASDPSPAGPRATGEKPPPVSGAFDIEAKPPPAVVESADASGVLDWGDGRYVHVKIADPYVELHTGPGRGYPVFHVVERGTYIEVLKRRTDWFKVRTRDRREGWVSRAQMVATLQPSGERTAFKDGSREDFTEHHWEGGVMAGDFAGARMISLHGAYAFNETLSAELTASHVLGRFSNSYFATLSLTHVFVPQWRVSPFFTLGTGIINTQPKATLTQAVDRTDQMAFLGAGIRAYLTRRFMLRLEYKSDVVFTSRDDNEEIDQWQGGFSFFF